MPARGAAERRRASRRRAVRAAHAGRRRDAARRPRRDRGELLVPGLPGLRRRLHPDLRRRRGVRREHVGVAGARRRRAPRGRHAQHRVARSRRGRHLQQRPGRRRPAAAHPGDARHVLLAGLPHLHRLSRQLRGRARCGASRSPRRSSPRSRRRRRPTTATRSSCPSRSPARRPARQSRSSASPARPGARSRRPSAASGKAEAVVTLARGQRQLRAVVTIGSQRIESPPRHRQRQARAQLDHDLALQRALQGQRIRA